MNTQMLRYFSILPIFALSAVVQYANAHDPALHAKEAAAKNAAPDCASMQALDHSKIDANDPVMKAMMLKCAEAPQGEMQGMDHTKMQQGEMQGMDHSQMQPSATMAPTQPESHGGH